MTADEVNEQFPMIKYGSWASDPARKGLPTFGGLSVPAGRANNTHDTNSMVLDISVKDRHSTEQRHPSDLAANSIPEIFFEREEMKDVEKTEHMTKQPADPGQASWTQASRQDLRAAPNSNDLGEDGHIDAALPNACPKTRGDTCAICISTLEDDNDIRELICGHTFHAVCIDPWLTSRRSCCPLCNAGCYMPRSRSNPEGDPDAGFNFGLSNNSWLCLPSAPRAARFRGSNLNSSHQGTWLIRISEESRFQRANQDQP